MVHPGVQKLIDLLKTVDDSPTSKMGFDMSRWYTGREFTVHPCGSACCIDGWAEWALRTSGNSIEAGAYAGVGAAVVKYCDLPDAMDWEIMNQLTCPSRWEDIGGGGRQFMTLKNIKLYDAIRMLEIFRDTGHVDWLRAITEAKGPTNGLSGCSKAN